MNSLCAYTKTFLSEISFYTSNRVCGGQFSPWEVRIRNNIMQIFQLRTAVRVVHFISNIYPLPATANITVLYNTLGTFRAT